MVKKLINGKWVMLEPVTFHLPSRDVIAYRRVCNDTDRESKAVVLRRLNMFGGE